MVASKANGFNKDCAVIEPDARPGLWDRLQLNEWTFSLFLLAFTMSVALGKLCVNYGGALGWQDHRYTVASVPNFSQLYTASDTAITEKWGWLIKAFACGLTMTGFTWYIIYKDSYIPGINPPFPFGSVQQRCRSSTGLQLNYLLGLLNGMLIFLYMCL